MGHIVAGSLHRIHKQIEEWQIGNQLGTIPKGEIKKILKGYLVLVEAVDMATDLLPIPERHQDQEWTDKEKIVQDTFNTVDGINQRDYES